jgi:Zn-dependent peptidase ImmA (M78 family)
MTKVRSNAQIERWAEARVLDYERRFGVLWDPPIPVERIAETIFNLRILWEPIEADGVLNPLAGLRSTERLIIINEDRREDFDRWPGLLPFTLGHELGHWDLHVDHTENPSFEGFEPPAGAFQKFRSSGGEVEVLLGRLHDMSLTPEEVDRAYHELTKGEDSPLEARQANRYAGALLMPSRFMIPAIRGLNLQDWRTLRDLRAKFQVSMTALKIRLEHLGVLHVAADGTFHRSRAEASGQSAFL